MQASRKDNIPFIPDYAWQTACFSKGHHFGLYDMIYNGFFQATTKKCRTHNRG